MGDVSSFFWGTKLFEFKNLHKTFLQFNVFELKNFKIFLLLIFSAMIETNHSLSNWELVKLLRDGIKDF
jgi:hypothetical protein